MWDTVNPWRCSRERQCVKLPVKSPSSPGLHSVASVSAYKMSQFHTRSFQEPAFSLGASDFKILEIYLYCVYPLHFRVRETCQQFAMGIGRRNEGERAGNTGKPPAIFISSMHNNMSSQAQLSGVYCHDKTELSCKHLKMRVYRDSSGCTISAFSFSLLGNVRLVQQIVEQFCHLGMGKLASVYHRSDPEVFPRDCSLQLAML